VIVRDDTPYAAANLILLEQIIMPIFAFPAGAGPLRTACQSGVSLKIAANPFHHSSASP
jgi:hypothetical protein